MSKKKTLIAKIALLILFCILFSIFVTSCGTSCTPDDIDTNAIEYHQAHPNCKEYDCNCGGCRCLAQKGGIND